MSQRMEELMVTKVEHVSDEMPMDMDWSEGLRMKIGVDELNDTDSQNVKDEPVSEDYEEASTSQIAKKCKDEPDSATISDPFQISAVFHVGGSDDSNDSTVNPVSISQLSSSALISGTTHGVFCKECGKILSKGQTAFQPKGSSKMYCSVECLASVNPQKKTCFHCSRELSSTESVVSAQLDPADTMKDFCSQKCLSAMSFSCQVCQKTSLVYTHTINFSGAVHKLCSYDCFNQFCSTNNICENCGVSCNHLGSTRFTLQIENRIVTFCKHNCKESFKKKFSNPVSCKMCQNKCALSDMMECLNTDGTQELYCSSSCITAKNNQGVGLSDAAVECFNCKKSAPLKYHVALPHGTLRKFCSYSCVDAYQEVYSKGNSSSQPVTTKSKSSLKRPAESSSSGKTGQTVTKIPCSQCHTSFFHKPELLEFKHLLYRTSSLAPKNIHSRKNIGRSNAGEWNEQKCNEGAKNVHGNHKVGKKLTIALKKEIIEKHECGIRVTDLALEYNMAKSTISTILKRRVEIKMANVAKGVTTLSKQRTQVLEDVEKLLLVWLNENQLAGKSVSETMICEKARNLHGDLLKNNPSTSSASHKFKASRGWFEKFCKRSGIRSVTRYGKASKSHKVAAEAYRKEFVEFLKAEGYTARQVFNCDETGLFWKKLPNRTHITQEEKTLSGHKPMKDRLTLLLCANASADLKIKPLLVYHTQTPLAFREQNVDPSRLPVMWRSNAKAWVTRKLFMEWLCMVFAPTVKKYLSDNGLPERCLLLMDSAPAHPPDLMYEMGVEYDFIKVRFLPPNTTPLLQPMDQQVISNFKKLYTKALFSMCSSQVTEEMSSSLKEFWKKHFSVVDCISLIDKAWDEVTCWTLNSAWRKLWPDCVSGCDLEETDSEIVDEIVSMGRGLGLNVEGADIEELVEEHKEELTTEELSELHREQQRELCTMKQEKEEEITFDTLNSIMEKWKECQDFFAKHHPNITVVNRVLNLMNDNVVSHFWEVLESRRRQIDLDVFLTKMADRKSPGGDLPSTISEGESSSKH